MSQVNADDHDLEKLGRWHQDLSGGTLGTFPVYALFLVRGEDRSAHDVFRSFRSSFEVRGAGFDNLMIFGQHGISNTARGFLDGLGLTEESLPLLALFSNPSADAVYTIPLASGISAGESSDDSTSPTEALQRLLRRFEEGIDNSSALIDLAQMPGLVKKGIKDGDMINLAARLLHN